MDDLHRLLRAARIRTPIIYVGHSIAGLYGALFATAYPRELAGAVLVDPSFANQWRAMTASFTPDERKKLSEMMSARAGGPLGREQFPLEKSSPLARTSSGHPHGTVKARA